MDEKEFKAQLKEIFNSDAYEIFEGEIAAVNETEQTVDIEIDEELTIPDVCLRAASDGNNTGVILIPAVGSYVVFAMVRGTNDYVLLKTTAIDKIIIDITTSLTATIPTVELKCKKVTINADEVALKSGDIKIDADQTTINGGSNMGLAKVLAIAKQLNLIEADLTILKAVFSAGWTPVPTDGGAALKLAAAAWAGAALIPTQPTDLENGKVKH